MRPTHTDFRHLSLAIGLLGSLLCSLSGCGEDSASEDGGPTPPEAAAGHEAGAADASPAAEWVAFTDQTQWADAALDDDPLAAHQPEMIDCDIAGWREENGLLEVDTGRCNYAWLSQPALVDIPEGAPLVLELRHFDLTSPEPAQGHVALIFDDAVVWETTIDIPAKANVLTIELEAEHALPRGGRVGLHLHNHGQNTWGFVAARVQVGG